MTSRGKPRGRGGTRLSTRDRSSSPELISSTLKDVEVDVKPVIPRDPLPAASSAHAGPSRLPQNAGLSGGVAALLRKNDYTRNVTPSSTAPKFVPKMVRRQQADVKPFIKEVCFERWTSATLTLQENTTRQTANFTRGRGRGRGRGLAQNNAVQMTASGIFAKGPAQAPKIDAERKKQARADGPGNSPAKTLNIGLDDSKPDAKPKGKGKALAGADKDFEISSGDDSAEDDFDDVDYNPTIGLNGKISTVDLDNISREGEMAPITLPRDRGAILGSVQQALQNRDDLAQRNSSLKQTAGMDVDLSSRPGGGVADIPQTPEVVPNDDVKTGFIFDSPEEAAKDRLYVMQFPRLFPIFTPADRTPSILQPRPVDNPQKKEDDSVNVNSGMDIDEDEKKDVKPIIDPVQKLNKDAFVPGAWQGWGKNGGRQGRDLTELGFEGKIGKLKVHQSGKVSLILGHGINKIKYDILPAASASFLQEIAVSVTEPMKRPPYLSEDSDVTEIIEPGIYVMGQAERKFIVRPNIDQLLKEMEISRAKEKEKGSVKAEKAEEDGSESLFARPSPAAAPSVRRPGSKAASKPKAKAKAAAPA